MKKIIFLFLCLFCASSAIHAQEEIEDTAENYLEKVKTIDSTIATLYSVISGDKGVERDWKLFKFLFKPKAKLIPSGKNKDGGYDARYISPDDYINEAGKWLVENGFHEVEINREKHAFANMAQVFSTYETYKSKEDKKPFMRGINSIQLLNDGNRWWIINIYWAQETQENPIPKTFLQN